MPRTGDPAESETNTDPSEGLREDVLEEVTGAWDWRALRDNSKASRGHCPVETWWERRGNMAEDRSPKGREMPGTVVQGCRPPRLHCKDGRRPQNFEQGGGWQKQGKGLRDTWNKLLWMKRPWEASSFSKPISNLSLRQCFLN